MPLLRCGAKRVLVTLGGDGAMLVSASPISVPTESEAVQLGAIPAGFLPPFELGDSTIDGSAAAAAAVAAAEPYYYWAKIPGTPDKPVDTVGAGDTFMGAFVASYVDGKKRMHASSSGGSSSSSSSSSQGGADGSDNGNAIDDRLVLLAMARANVAAGISVTRPGTQTATPHAHEMPF